MHMILVGTDFEEMDVVSLCDLKAGLFDCLIDCFGEHYSPVFGRTDDVVHHHIYVVALVYVDAHLRSLASQQAAGYITLKGIKKPHRDWFGGVERNLIRQRSCP